MENKDLRKVEKRLIVIFILFGIIAIIAVTLFIKFSGEEQTGVKVDLEKTEEETLDDGTMLLPDNCGLYEEVPEFTFTTLDGEKHSIRDYAGKKVIITFWASWCPDCHEQMPLINKYLEMTKQYDDVTYILINKLDDKKESRDKAEKYLKDNEIALNNFYDDELKAYKLLGLHNVPTTLFIDEKGILKAWYPKQITSETVFEAYLNNMMEGNSLTTEKFIINGLMDSEGGIHSEYDKDKEQTIVSDVLAESQGAGMEYAVKKGDQKLFDQLASYIIAKKNKEGMIPWTVAGGEASNTNALIDDFRVYRAYADANRLWGGYETEMSDLEEGFAKYGMKDNRFEDFYDAKSKAYGKRITLCFADFEAMDRLKKKDAKFSPAYENAVEIVTKGQISKEFPLYYSWYNYKTGEYEKDELNTSEAMVTVLNLAKADLLQEDTITWIKDTMQNGGIKSRYSVDGEVVENYYYESTAVYALVAMIADEIGDTGMRADALEKMERMRINDTSLPYNNAFGVEDGTEISSFDQIMPMLAYQYAENE